MRIKNNYSLLIIGIVVAFNISLSQWNIQNTGTQLNIRSITFVDSVKGWAVGDSGIILFTSNSGNKWERQISNTTVRLNSVSFCDSTDGWAVGYEGVKLNTTNGGETWNRIYHDTASNVVNTKVKCFSKKSVYISRMAWYGDYYGGSKLWAYYSFANLSGWADISPYSGSGFIFLIIDFEFITPNYGWVIKRDGLNFEWVPQVSKTTDTGGNWTSNQIVSGGYISFSDSSNGLLTDGSRVFRYVDSSNSFIALDSLGFYSGTAICRIGNTSYVNSISSIMKSSDNKIWSKQPFSSGTTIYDIKFITPEIGWATGNNGLIMHTTNGGITKVVNNMVEQFNFSLNQNYPNPFNPSTTIEYQLPKSGFVTLRLYDVLGREISTLVEEVKEYGKHSQSWNASQYSSGVYFVKCQYDGKTITKKIMLQK